MLLLVKCSVPFLPLVTIRRKFGYGDDTTSSESIITFIALKDSSHTNVKVVVIEDGDYSVTANIVSPYSAWIQPGDHTTKRFPLLKEEV
jgi:hypothetical protein